MKEAGRKFLWMLFLIAGVGNGWLGCLHLRWINREMTTFDCHAGLIDTFVFDGGICLLTIYPVVFIAYRVVKVGIPVLAGYAWHCKLFRRAWQLCFLLWRYSFVVVILFLSLAYGIFFHITGKLAIGSTAIHYLCFVWHGFFRGSIGCLTGARYLHGNIWRTPDVCLRIN